MSVYNITSKLMMHALTTPPANTIEISQCIFHSIKLLKTDLAGILVFNSPSTTSLRVKMSSFMKCSIIKEECSMIYSNIRKEVKFEKLCFSYSNVRSRLLNINSESLLEFSSFYNIEARVKDMLYLYGSAIFNFNNLSHVLSNNCILYLSGKVCSFRITDLQFVNNTCRSGYFISLCFNELDYGSVYNSNFVNSSSSKSPAFIKGKNAITTFKQCVFQRVVSPLFVNDLAAFIFHECYTDNDFYIGDTFNCFENTNQPTNNPTIYAKPDSCAIIFNDTIKLSSMQKERKSFSENTNFILKGCTLYEIKSTENGGAIAIVNTKSVLLTMELCNFYKCSSEMNGGAMYIYSDKNQISMDRVCYSGCRCFDIGYDLMILHSSVNNITFCSFIESLDLEHGINMFYISTTYSDFKKLNVSQVKLKQYSLFCLKRFDLGNIKYCNYYNITSNNGHVILTEANSLYFYNSNFAKVTTIDPVSSLFVITSVKILDFTSCVIKDIQVIGEDAPIFVVRRQVDLGFRDCVFEVFGIDRNITYRGYVVTQKNLQTIDMFIEQTACYLLPYMASNASIIVFAVLFFTSAITLILLFIYLKITAPLTEMITSI